MIPRETRSRPVSFRNLTYLCWNLNQPVPLRRLLWDEVQEMTTPEARYANALDRLQSLLLNFHSGGRAWREHRIAASQVRERMLPVQNGAPQQWSVAERVLEQAVEKGYL